MRRRGGGDNARGHGRPRRLPCGWRMPASCGSWRRGGRVALAAAASATFGTRCARPSPHFGRMTPAPEPPLLMSESRAREMLGCGAKVFRQHVLAGDIEFVLVGKRRRFRLSALNNFIDRQTCQYTSQRSLHSSITTSKSTGFDFMEARALRQKKKREITKPKYAAMPKDLPAPGACK